MAAEIDPNNWVRVQVQDTGHVVYGTVHSMNASGVAVALETVPVRPDVLVPGRATEVILPLQHAQYKTNAQVVSCQGAQLLLSFTKALQPSQRRGSYRLECALAVMFRVLHGAGHAGAWQSGTSEDVSAGGMKLNVEKCAQPPREIELRFLLPGDPRQIIATAKVAHAQANADGGVTLGLSFRAISSTDSVRLVNFIEASHGQAAA